ncbi:penicillin-insensitive murein endopeptidase [uncultured Rhodoblastus sp.]|uniref:penicillin-insensitive murein endopeptidase n=1 Tax=uncultured Rhodoblastus sp. TaxID=543037 RepID=UPI0025D5B608|nr:penicillin-insensitive murein endopeptidase [uncultured Rhodoblastus sp.]
MPLGASRDRLTVRLLAAAALTAPLCLAALAQEKGSVDPRPLPPLAHPDAPTTPAKELFGRAAGPADLAARSIGFYSRGCLAGAKALPVSGETWQVMRLSRDRYWGHPNLVRFLENLSSHAPREAGWPGILVGDMSQPRGGPMITGHASHQIGLDADIWLTPMPGRQLSRREREEMSAVNMVREDGLDIDRSAWTPGQMAIIHAAALDPGVERIFVNAAIKKALCREATGDRSWLHKVRPYYGHNYHFHVRIACPDGADLCQEQDPVPPGEGCDAAALDWWFKPSILHPRLNPNAKPKPPLTLSSLPPECRRVLLAK